MTDYDEKPKGKPNFPCPVCGGTEFEWGVIGNAGQLRFIREADIGSFNGAFAPYHLIDSRHCLTCHNVLFFANPEIRRD
jgi:hypothetical protein